MECQTFVTTDNGIEFAVDTLEHDGGLWLVSSVLARIAIPRHATANSHNSDRDFPMTILETSQGRASRRIDYASQYPKPSSMAPPPSRYQGGSSTFERHQTWTCAGGRSGHFLSTPLFCDALRFCTDLGGGADATRFGTLSKASLLSSVPSSRAALTNS